MYNYLDLTIDNSLLVAMNKDGGINYWKLCSNKGSISLNLSGDESEKHTYNQGLMSTDKEMLMLVVGKQSSEVWNVKD